MPQTQRQQVLTRFSSFRGIRNEYEVTGYYALGLVLKLQPVRAPCSRSERQVKVIIMILSRTQAQRKTASDLPSLTFDFLATFQPLRHPYFPR